MVAGLTGTAVARVSGAAALAALAVVAARLALVIADLASIYWVGRRADGVGT
ncbi:hypothetical protein [Sphingomonas sp. NBWT7]|uniref:hypothetical protein n=1 Tax=Sphingomonas sp. NBWT7 TaxID=2596913 RepID=UPI0016242205|nr:hypothetical protein [Sphingomonas sp. NBWT7]